METGTLIAIVVAAVVVIVLLLVVVRKRRRSLPGAERPSETQAILKPKAVVPPLESKVESKVEPAPVPTALSKEEQSTRRLAQKLSKTRNSFLGKIEGLFNLKGPGERELQAQEWESVEEAFLGADVGITTTTALLNRVRERMKESQKGESIRTLVLEESRRLLAKSESNPFDLTGKPKPYVIEIVGVNGVGKTTTIGKLAHHFKSQGKSVLLGAGDTFRAAAISQLKIWSDRVGTQFVTGREGADPGAVAFDAATAAKAREVDVVLLDTAGRLHTKSSLMDELKKVDRVLKKVIPEAPHEVWLILDGTLGQNSIQQAKEFKKALDLTGVIVTKLDGTAKGGAMLAVSSELELPVRYIGVGESMEDLIPFEPDQFVSAILG